MAFGWMGATTALASVVRKPEQLVIALNRRALRATHAAPGRPQAREGEQRPILAQREPRRRLARLGVRVLAK